MKSSLRKFSFGTSLAVLIICLVLVTGSTFSLFTSKTGTNIAVTSGNVEMVATIDADTLALCSKGVAQTGKFQNGGTAVFNEAKTELTLTNITPGDKVEFNIVVENKSNVDLQYRINWIKDGDLAEALTATVNGADITSGTSEWTLWKADATEKTQTLTISIELPLEADDTWESLEANIAFNVEAVQANATGEYSPVAFVNTAAGLQAAIDAGATEIIFNNDIAITTPIEIKDEVELNLNGKTVEGNLVLVDGADLTIANGVLINNDSSVSAIQVNGGNLTIDDVEITSARHALRIEGNGSVVEINGGKYVAKDSAGMTHHALNVGDEGKSCTVIINGGEFIGPAGTASDSGAAVNVKAGSTVTINGGNFSGGKNNTLSGAEDTLTVKGGTFDQNPSAYVATGYHAVKAGNVYYVVPEGVAYVSNSNELMAAIDAGNKEIYLLAGTFEFDWANRDLLYGVTIIGTSAEASTLQFTGNGPGTWYLNGLTLKNVTVVDHCKGETNTYSYWHSYFDVSGLTATNVVFKTGVQTAEDASIFTDCTFVSGYYWNYGAQAYSTEEMYGLVANGDVTVEGCSFTGFRGIDVSAACNVTVNNCTFNVTNTEKPAINVKNDDATVTVDGAVLVANQAALQAAIANGNKNVALANDITVDKWIMFSETLSVASGNIITIKMDGLTIDGNGHTLTVNAIESAGNGNMLFNDASNLNIHDLTIKYADGLAGGISLKSGVISNVTFDGGKYGVYPGSNGVTIEDCTFKSEFGIYYETERQNVTVTGNTFNCTNYSIYLRGNETFTGNTVVTGKVNIVSGSPVVTGNNFGKERFKVYNGATATIEGNTINNLVFNDAKKAQSSSFSNNKLSKEAQAALDAVPQN